MTQQQLQQNIQALEKQGASQGEIQSYINTVKIDSAPKKNIFQKVGGALISSEKNFSDTLTQGFMARGNTGKMIEEANSKLIKSGNDLIKLAQTKTDLSEKQKILDLAKKNFEQAGVNWKEVLPSVEKTNKQVLGEAAGVGLDVLSAGSFGSTSKVPTVLKPLQTSIKQGFKKGALQGAEVGVPLGAAYGATNAMQEGSGIATGATVGAVAGGVGGALISGIVGGVSAKLAAKTTVELQKAESAVNKILLGTKEDIKIGLRELGQLDTKGVKTFDDLLTSINTKIEYLSSRVDEKLGQNTTLYKLNDLVKNTKVGGKTVSHNYVNDALMGLQEMYTKIVSPDDAERIAQLIVKANNEGLTIQEINNIAREFGVAFKNKAFSARTGEQLTSLSGQAFESIRAGVKSTLREFTDETTKLLDQQTSRLMRIRSLVAKNSESANKLAQRMEKSGLFNNLIRRFGLAASTARDVYARAFYKPSATDVKLDILQIEKQLYKNLQFLRKLEKSGDRGIFNWIEKTINKSNGIISDLKNNQQGFARVPKILDAEGRDALIYNLDNIKPMDLATIGKNKQVDMDMFGRIETLKKIFEKGKDTPADIKEAQEILARLGKLENPLDNVKLSSSKLTGLEQEARKYKSAEEFVKAQTFYRGEEGSVGGGNYFTKNYEFANEFAGTKSVTEKVIPENLIYRPKGKLGFVGNEADVTKAIQEAKNNGYKAVYLSEGSPFGKPIESVFVFDKSALQTKSQLTDIWNKANKYKFPKKK